MNTNKSKRSTRNNIPLRDLIHCGFQADVKGGKPPQTKRGMTQIKVVDTNFSGSPLTTGTVTDVFPPAQSLALNGRTGDVVYLKDIYLLYVCSAANADTFSTMRVILFQWKVNSALAVPNAGNILQSAATSGIVSFLDWNFADQFTILYDRIHSFAGLATAPTSSTNQNSSIKVQKNFQKRVNFTLGATSGSEKIYLLTISDSAIAPSPSIVGNCRITYSEE
jgi:hypothetical protein